MQPTDLVVVGIGVEPRVALAEQAGLEARDGIVVDERLVSSDLRVEHWATALRQGAHVARSALGGQHAYDRLPYFFSDQYDLGLEYRGHARDGDDLLAARLAGGARVHRLLAP